MGGEASRLSQPASNGAVVSGPSAAHRAAGRTADRVVLRDKYVIEFALARGLCLADLTKAQKITVRSQPRTFSMPDSAENATDSKTYACPCWRERTTLPKPCTLLGGLVGFCVALPRHYNGQGVVRQRECDGHASASPTRLPALRRMASIGVSAEAPLGRYPCSRFEISDACAARRQTSGIRTKPNFAAGMPIG